MNDKNIFKRKNLGFSSWTAIIITLVLVGLFIAGIVLHRHIGLILTGIIPLAFLLINRFRFIQDADFKTITIGRNDIIFTSKGHKKLVTKSFSADLDIRKIHLSETGALIDLNDETFFTLNAKEFRKEHWETIERLLQENFGDKVSCIEKKDNKIVFLKSMAMKILLIGVFFALLFLGINVAISISIRQITLSAVANALVLIYFTAVIITSSLFRSFIIVGQDNFYYIADDNSKTPTKSKSFRNLKEINYLYQKTKNGKKALPVLEFRYSDREPWYIETYASKKEFNTLSEAILSHMPVTTNNYVQEVKSKLKSLPDRKKSIVCAVFAAITFAALIPLFIINNQLDDNSPYLPASTISMFAVFIAFILSTSFGIQSRNKVEKLKQNSEHIHIQGEINSDSPTLTDESQAFSTSAATIHQMTFNDGFGGKLDSFHHDSVSDGILYYKEISSDKFDAFYLPKRTNSFWPDAEQSALQIDGETVYNYLHEKFGTINITCAVIFNYKELSESEKVFFANESIRTIHNGDTVTEIGLCGICENSIYFNEQFDPLIERTFVKSKSSD